jgi:cytochrome c-type biogenesis protein
MLIVFAVLIATNTLTYIADWMIRYVPWFTTIG